jgi:colicin import membrane protein
MSSANTTQNLAGQYRRGLVISAAAHVLALLALSSSLILLPQKPITSRAISAFVVDENSLQQSTSTRERPPEPVVAEPPPQQQEQERREQELAEQKIRQENERKEQERKAVEVQAEAERKEQNRKAAEVKAKAEAERKQAEAKTKAEAERKEQERKAAEAKAEADRKAEVARQEKARREAELAAAMAAEEDLWAAQQSGEMDRYIALIQQKVQRNWVPPASAQPGLECEVAVVQLPNGDVVDARTVRCNGDAAVQRSIEAAVRRSSPLPMPDNRALFERNLRFIFKPQQ